MIHAFPRVHGVIGPGQERHHGNQWNRGNVLKQQNRERHPPMRAVQLLALCQALQAESGGRQRQAQAENDRRIQRLAEGKQRDCADHQTGQHHLRHAHAEHRFAHHPQALRRQLKTNDEQQQYHAEFRNMADTLRVADQPQHRGADDHARE